MTESRLDQDQVERLAAQIKHLVPSIADLGAYADQGALALAQAALTSGLNPFLGEIWIIPKTKNGPRGRECEGFSIKPGIKGARRAARNQAAQWGLIPPYYRPVFREPSDFEAKLIGAGAQVAAVACDLELVLPPDHPWYRDAAGGRYTVTGLGMAGGGSRMAPFQQARKRAEEDALKLAFDLPVYGEDGPEESDPGTGVTGHSRPDLRIINHPAAPPPEPEAPPVGNGILTGTQGIDMTHIGANFWHNMTGQLEADGIIPSRGWLIKRLRDMGVTQVTEDNAQDLVRQALEDYHESEAPAPDPDSREPIGGGRQVDTQTGEITEAPPERPFSPAQVGTFVQSNLQAALEKHGHVEAIDTQRDIYTRVIGQLTKDPGEEGTLLFQLFYSQDPEALQRAELGAFFAWCLDPTPVDGRYGLNEWAVEEARAIIKEQADLKAEAKAERERREAEAEAHAAAVAEIAANATEIPLPEETPEDPPADPEDTEDPPTIQELEAAAETSEPTEAQEQLPFTDPPEADPEEDLEDPEDDIEDAEHEPDAD